MSIPHPEGLDISLPCSELGSWEQNPQVPGGVLPGACPSQKSFKDPRLGSQGQEGDVLGERSVHWRAPEKEGPCTCYPTKQ